MGGAMTPAARLLPPLTLMAVIFLLSSQPHLSTGLGTWDLILRKAAHVTEYGLLWWLWHRALGHRHLAAAVSITLAYAATDEFHQRFVSGRHGTPVDVAVDAVGVAIAIALARRVAPQRQLHP
jgi:VanZ family protein